MSGAELIQGTPEWLAARVGLVTASRIADVLATTKSGPSASRAGYMGELVAERLTGKSAASTFTNADMQRGMIGSTNLDLLCVFGIPPTHQR